ncbi:MAG: hypothetical protein SFW67_10760 [Myxococcaceae bacterium]|nr:hypothetical protein [Myxococcaceae bacterium]
MDFGKPLLEATSDNGRVVIYRPANDVVVTVNEGFLTQPLWLEQLPVYDAIYASTPMVRTFLDSLAVRSFEPEYRDASQRYIKGKKSQIAEMVILQQSALIKLAVNAVSLFSGVPMEAETNRATFEARLGAALARKRAA